MEKLPSKHVWRNRKNIGIEPCSAANVAVSEDFRILCALQECIGSLSSYFVPLGSHPGPQWPFLGYSQCAMQFREFVFNEVVLWRSHHSGLLNQLGNMFEVWSRRVVPFRFHLFQKNHPQTDWLPSIGSSVFPKATSISVCSRKSESTSFCIALLCHGVLFPVFPNSPHAVVSNAARYQHRSARVGMMPQLRSALSKMFHHRRRGIIPRRKLFVIFILDDLACTAMEGGTGTAINGEETSTNHDSFTIVQSKTNKSK